MSAVHRVVALAIPDVVAFDLSIPAQVFGHYDERDRYSFAVCAERPGDVPTSTGFSVSVRHGLEALDHADTVLVPGFHPHLAPPDYAIDALRRVAARGTRIASVCIGAFALATAGLLDGRVATTHWQYADDFRRLHPQVSLNPDILYADEGQILTSAGISAGVDLCLHMVRLDYGANAAADVARRMVVAVHRTGGQAQYSQRPLPADGGLGDTLEWAITQMRRPLTVDSLAHRAGMSRRTFVRRFAEQVGTTPMRWLVGQRVLEAQRLLEATTLDVDDIADRCGFGSAAVLRLHLARQVGMTPTAYRRAARRPEPV
ncbi:helix-turn-helix domain-containing protein [Mycobacterium hodleri]|uniref:GlxA family transcriptional regulator n=1 Tax=Mycolicibacterium hodleri TaxID=49897 RepID=UPI0021F2DC14|nr:helix-turn-helix domain-containing protein [Mycolicibacterium hodleri]MCV7134433.1 helix-turn-helix domain-containing protein [Mycolicibacterium hodleri]